LFASIHVSPFCHPLAMFPIYHLTVTNLSIQMLNQTRCSAEWQFFTGSLLLLAALLLLSMNVIYMGKLAP
jgi:hypothetical protein